MKLEKNVFGFWGKHDGIIGFAVGPTALLAGVYIRLFPRRLYIGAQLARWAFTFSVGRP